MDAPHPAGARVRWLVAGAFLPSPSGRRFLLTADSFAEQLEHAASRLSITVQDRIGSGDAITYEASFDRLSAFQLSEVVAAIPDLRALHAAHDALSSARPLTPEEAAHLEAAMGPGRLSSAMAKALRDPRASQDIRRAGLAILEEAIFTTARDILQHPLVTRLESAWRGLHWLSTHCPDSAGLEIQVLDVGPHQLVDALSKCLDEGTPLQRPDACFILDSTDDVDTLHQLAALGEQAWLPMVVAVPPDKAAHPPEAWARLRVDEASRWLCAALNPVLMLAERHGTVRRECFASPALAVAAVLATSFRDTRTFARLTGPGSGTRAPAVWHPQGSSSVATQAVLSLREQERLAAQGLVGVSGWWDTSSVLLAAAPTVYGGRDKAPLAAQLLTGRVVRLAQELAERLPSGTPPDTVAAAFSRAAEAFLSSGSGPTCQLHGQVVSTGDGGRGVLVRASLRPELAGTHLQLAFTVPLSG